MKIAVLYISHNQRQHVKVGMKLIRKLWISEPLLYQTDIYHANNDNKKRYSRIYLENKLIRRRNLGHYRGAADLINAGAAEIFKSPVKYDYLIVMSGDVWLIKPRKISDVVNIMQKQHYQLAATLWPNTFFFPTYFATEFFIIKQDLALKLFPLNITECLHRHPILAILSLFLNKIPYLTVPEVELCFTDQLLSVLNIPFWNLKWIKYIYLIPGRKIFFGVNRYYSPKLGYLSHPSIERKLKICKYEPSVMKISASV